MIGFLKGIVDTIELDHCLLDVGGVGYRIAITHKTSGQLHLAMPVKIYTHLAVREDDMSLYGFLSGKELETFKILIGVSGIGARVAMGILGDIEADDLAIAISQKDIGRLTKISGIGKKTAERMLLELKDKIGTDLDVSNVSVSVSDHNADEASSVVEVLRSLGYQMQEINRAISRIDLKEMNESEAVKAALKELSKGR